MSYKKIIGISAYYHDSAAALVIDGVVVAAAQEERFTRIKQDDAFPTQAVQYCLSHAGLDISDIDAVVFYDKPILKFERLLQTYFTTWPRGLNSFIKAMMTWLGGKLWIERNIRKTLSFEGTIFFTRHHISHAAGAYYNSGFADAAVVTLDGVGEWDTTTIAHGKGRELTINKSIHFPHSIGLLYSAVTYYLGFKVNSAEYKVMGLAPYGDPEIYRERMERLVTRAPDGSFALNREFFSYEYGLTMTNRTFNSLFGGKSRRADEPLTKREKDIAASLQELTEKLVMGVVKEAKRITNSPNLCLSGGVALNCVANGKILSSALFDAIYIQPASGDAGGAVGAALFVYHQLENSNTDALPKPGMQTVFLGPEYTAKEIESFLLHEAPQLAQVARVYSHTYPDDVLFEKVAELIEGDNAIGWFQGRMEFGPRALGNRSILADPRNKENWQKINLKIKFRESFRPFAPSVMEEHAHTYFDLSVPSPYMLLVAPVRVDTIPAVTHVDNTARIQTVNKEQNPRYYQLLDAFYKRTGCPVLINTSFNVRSEPIVMSPTDAFRCFLNTEMDYLVLGNVVIAKTDNPGMIASKEEYISRFQLD